MAFWVCRESAGRFGGRGLSWTRRRCRRESWAQGLNRRKANAERVPMSKVQCTRPAAFDRRPVSSVVAPEDRLTLRARWLCMERFEVCKARLNRDPCRGRPRQIVTRRHTAACNHVPRVDKRRLLVGHVCHTSWSRSPHLPAWGCELGGRVGGLRGTDGSELAAIVMPDLPISAQI
jgi:hypothetical protein